MRSFPVKEFDRSDGPRRGGETLRRLGWPEQTQAAGTGDVGLAERRLAEVGSAAGSTGHWRRDDLNPAGRAPPESALYFGVRVNPKGDEY